jgi:lysozyme family protein
MNRDELKKIFKGEYWDEKDVDKKAAEILEAMRRGKKG